MGGNISAAPAVPRRVTPGDPLPAPIEQADRLIRLGVLELAGLAACEFRVLAAEQTGHLPNPLLVIHPDLVSAAALAPLLTHAGKPGFVVVDMPDLDAFAPITQIALPPCPMYTVHEPDRGDHMANWTPDEALPAILEAGRTPLTVSEGIHWLLQVPDALERNHCFMTIGSRVQRPGGRVDTRVPALWISNGTGRDGAANRNAPKVGWCWAGNRHTWLAFASAAKRMSAPTQPLISGSPVVPVGRD